MTISLWLLYIFCLTCCKAVNYFQLTPNDSMENSLKNLLKDDLTPPPKPVTHEMDDKKTSADKWKNPNNPLRGIIKQYKTKKCADNKSCDLNELNRHIGKEINSELYVKMLRFSQKSSTPKDMEMTMSVSNDMKSILAVAQSLKSILSIIGFKDSNDCLNNSLKNMQSLRECGLDFFTEAAAAFDTLYESALLSTRVLAGGRKAQNALARLTHIFTAPYGPQCLRATGIPLCCLVLSGKEATPDHLRWQALSLVTLLSNVPSATTIDDVSSGGFGHVNIVLPSPSRIYEPGKLAQELTLGLNPNVLPEGNLYENEVLSSDESF